MGNILDIGLMIALYIMMMAISLLSKKEEPKAAKNIAVICIIISFLFIIGWVATTFGFLRLLQN